MHRTKKLYLVFIFGLARLLAGGVDEMRAQPTRVALTNAAPALPASANDLGRAPAATPIRRMHLVLARTAGQEAALAALLDQQQDKKSAQYRQWVSPAEFGSRFGASDAALAKVTAWLAGQGFTEVRVNNGRTLVEFSGTVGSVEAAFQTTMHAVRVGAETRYANRTAASIPASLVSTVKSVASLNNLSAPAAVTAPVAKAAAAIAKPAWTLNSNNTTYYAVTPNDFAAIYNVLPLWNAASPIDGTGQSIAVVGDTDINPADFVNFRKLFGLPLGSTTSQTGTQYLNIIYNGPQPPLRADEFHADSDTQWASAIAKGATINYVASETTEASAGNDLSAAYIVDNNLAPILVDSYSQCELSMGTARNAFYSALWQQASAQGITVVAAAGDSGAAGCDGARVGPASMGKAVNGIASTPYNVAVGGTEFYAPNGLGAYFSTTNSASFGSVSGYIPEVVWNDSCTNPAILAQAPYTGLTAEQACNTAAAKTAGLEVVAGSGGGASNCTASNSVSAASCSGGYLKPGWQTGPGIPADGLRDTPDVALFASQGRTNSFYAVCQQSRDTDGQPCNLSYPYSDFAAYGGTELATPAFGGIMALAVQKMGARIGNPNYTLYGLATQQAQAGTNCSATGSPAASCIFHDITIGTNAMPCSTGTTNCVTATAGDANGILSAGATSAGYDFASGLGSVDVANLVNSWASITFHSTSALLTVYPSQVTHGSPITATVSVTSNGAATPILTGEVSINSQAGNGSVGSGPLSGGLFSQTFRNFPGGSYGVVAHYSGDAVNGPTDSNYVSVTVLPENSSTTLQTLAYNPVTGTATQVSAAPYGNIYYIRANVNGSSGEGVATGNVAITDEGVILGSGVYRLNSSGYTEAQNNAVAPGNHLFAASYAGDASFNPSTAASASLVVTQAATTAVVTSNVATVSISGTVTLSAVVSTTSFGYAAPSGIVTFYMGSQVLGASTLVAGSDATTYYRNATATLTLSASPFPIGNQVLTVAFAGDTNYLASTSSATPLTVTGTTLLPTMTTVSATPSSVSPGGTITFFAAVSAVSGSAVVHTGSLQFVVDGQNLSAPVALSANGSATVSTAVTSWVVGPHAVVAVYSGDTISFRSSASLPAPFLISTPGLTSVPNFTATPSAAVQGTFVSVAVNILPTSPSLATGTVQLVLDGGLYGSAIALGSNATAILPLITSRIQVGSHVMTVFYSGNGTFASAYAAPATITIAAPGVTTSAVTLTGLPAGISPGAGLSFTASVSPTKPTPTGVFQIILDGANPGSPILLTGTSTTLSVPSSSLPLGSHAISVFYSGDAIYNFSTSAVANVTVAPPVLAGSFTLTPAVTNLTVGVYATGITPVIYTLTSQNGYSAPVNLACINVPAYTDCTMTPAIVSLQGVPTAVSVLTLTFNTGFHSDSHVPSRPGERVELPITFAGLVFGLALYRRSRRWRPALLVVVVTISFGLFSGCGNGYHFGTTPTGTYALNVIATGGTTTQTATLNLTVQ